MNCGQCGSIIMAGEPIGHCLSCSRELCESCHADYCRPCDLRFAANCADALAALAAEEKPDAMVSRLLKTHKPFSEMTRTESREMADVLGYGD